MALRRELEEKKRREGKLKEPELNPKQKEAMKAQLEKESTIRSRLTLVGWLVGLFQALCRNCESTFS